MPTQEDYIKFKSVLEYFVSHLMYIQSNDTSSQGYHKYIKPLVDGKKFIFNGRQGGTLQRQIAEWNELSIGAIAVTFQNNFGQGYWTKKCYINWVDTGVNVFANWDTDGHIVSLCLAVYCGKNLIKYAEGFNFSLQDLGLFTPQQTDVFIKFTNKYFEMYQTLNQQEETALYCNLLTNNHNLILTGAPGTGKTYFAKEIAKAMGAEYKLVQFHPSYDYTDFVEGLRPTGGNGQVGFQRTDGVFKKFCKKALDDFKESNSQSKKFVFIIDEINRGEISKIFGELFLSIDPGYRGVDGLVQTQYQNLVKNDDDFKEGFFVPENVYIIGTMNDIDRSVESMDFAFRRRFAFKEVTAKDSQKMLDNDEAWGNRKPDVDKLKNRMDNLNDKISAIPGLNSAYHIGGAYFLKLKYYEGDEKDRYNELWNNHLNGVLREYLRGNPKIEDYMTDLRKAYDDESKHTKTSN